MEKEEEKIANLKNRPLERIFQNNISRILDFFIYNQNFDFSTSEVSDISDVPLRTVQRIIPHLVKKENKEITINTKNRVYELNKNSELVEILNKYSIATMNSFIRNAQMIEQKDKKIIPLSNIIQEKS